MDILSGYAFHCFFVINLCFKKRMDNLNESIGNGTVQPQMSSTLNLVDIADMGLMMDNVLHEVGNASLESLVGPAAARSIPSEVPRSNHQSSTSTRVGNKDILKTNLHWMIFFPALPLFCDNGRLVVWPIFSHVVLKFWCWSFDDKIAMMILS